MNGKSKGQEEGLLMDEWFWLDLKWKLEESIKQRHMGRCIYMYIYIFFFFKGRLI